MIERPATPVGLDVCLRSTADIQLSILRSTFEEEISAGEAEIDEQQFFFKSFDAPSFVQIVAALPWWYQLAVGAVTPVAVGYLNAAGASLWENQGENLARLTKRLWSVADRIVTLSNLIEPRTKIMLAVPSGNEPFSLHFEVTDFSRDAVAIQIAALCYHARTLETFIESEAFDPAIAGWLKIEPDGGIVLHWQDNATLVPKSQLFPV
jgi:hypothetical protein